MTRPGHPASVAGSPSIIEESVSDPPRYSRRRAVRPTTLVAVALLMGACTGAQDPAAPEPLPIPPLGEPLNVVFILADDLGWTDLGVMGSGYYETPSIDRLAAEGLLFTDAYANAPNCAPTRASLLSGYYPPRHGVYTVGTSERGPARRRKLIPIRNREDLSHNFVTIAERLQEAGYATAHIGKWHLGRDKAAPDRQGFDINIGGHDLGGAHDHFFPYGPETRQLPGLEEGEPGEYLADRLTDEALAWMSDHADERFFLYLSHYSVHTPIQAKQELIDRFADKPPSGGHDSPVYAGMVASLDESVGRVLEQLDALGIADETLVVFFSDNGGYGPITSAAPLRGAKGMMYEGGIRVPLIVRWPGRTTPGSTCDTPVIGLDFYPTLLDAARLEIRDELDGLSLAGEVYRCGTLPSRPLYWHFPAYLANGEEAGAGGFWRTTPAGVIRDGDLKLIEYFEDSSLELYDLAADIGESVNLAERRPEETARLLAAMRAWRERVEAPVPTEPEPEYRPPRERRRKAKGEVGG